MQPGPADKSYGIHVAKLAGMPDSLLQRADVILKRLENDSKKVTHHEETNEGPQVTPVIKEDESSASQVDEQLSLFQPETVKLDSQENELLEDIKTTNLMSLTPLEVMNKVFEWQQRLTKKGKRK